MSNAVDVFLQADNLPPLKEDLVIQFVDAVLERLGCRNWEVSVTLCDDNRIRELNQQYRGRDEATDILTFVMDEDPFPKPADLSQELFTAGDMVISLETLLKNSEYFHLSPGEELKRLLIHGLLHLKGMDHPEDDYTFTSEMLKLQEDILKEFPGTEILGPL